MCSCRSHSPALVVRVLHALLEAVLASLETHVASLSAEAVSGPTDQFLLLLAHF